MLNEPICKWLWLQYVLLARARQKYKTTHHCRNDVCVCVCWESERERATAAAVIAVCMFFKLFLLSPCINFHFVMPLLLLDRERDERENDNIAWFHPHLVCLSLSSLSPHCHHTFCCGFWCQITQKQQEISDANKYGPKTNGDVQSVKPKTGKSQRENTTQKTTLCTCVWQHSLLSTLYTLHSNRSRFHILLFSVLMEKFASAALAIHRTPAALRSNIIKPLVWHM